MSVEISVTVDKVEDVGSVLQKVSAIEKEHSVNCALHVSVWQPDKYGMTATADF